MRALPVFTLCSVLLLSCALSSADQRVLYREEFSSLENWRPLTFPKIKKHTVYGAVALDGQTFLRTESNASASGLILKNEFDVYAHPGLRWRWKVDTLYKKADGKTKEGDDYPLRVYVVFKYDPEKASFGQRVRYGIAKALYGEYPPHSSINYVWASMPVKERVFSNPYADEAKMIVKQAGAAEVGKWVDEEVNIVDDYRKAFGVDPPPIASLAIMNDSDNTGERSVSYIDFIEIFMPGGKEQVPVQ